MSSLTKDRFLANYGLNMVEATGANHVLVLGGGLEPDESNDEARLSIASAQRVTRTTEYYLHNRPLFERDRENPWILCSGGYPGLSKGQTAPSRDNREAALMRNALIDAGLPDSLVLTEADSWSTVTNFTSCLAHDLFSPADFTVHHPLGIVTHPHHMRRALRVAAASGVEAVQPIPTSEVDGAVWEFILRTAITLGAKSIENMRRRETLIARLIGRQSVKS